MNVSVIIPTYNQETYLSSAIESVLLQTYANYELIVVDDGSTDNSPNVADHYRTQLRYVRQENQGLAGARNTGIRHATGTFVAFIDSDDRWQPIFLQKMTSLAAAYPEAAVYYCGSYYFDVDSHLLPQLATATVVPPEQTYHTLLRANFLNANAILLRRAAAIEAGLFDRNFRRLQDWEFWLQLARAGQRFIGTAEPLVYYRLHGQSLSADTSGGQEAALAIAQKHFGADDGRPDIWSPEKRRMYGGVYRYQVLLALQRRGDWPACIPHLKQALHCDPTLATDFDFFYEIALGAQPLGYRGTTRYLEISENAKQIERLLAQLFHGEARLPRRLQSPVTASAYYALGMVAYNTGALDLSRLFLAKASAAQPALYGDRQLITTLGKSIIGRPNVERLRRWRMRLAFGR